MTGRVFLHIGVMKSATSYLQGICEANRDHLAGKGLLWVGEELRYPAVRGLLGRGQGGQDGDAWANLLRIMREHPGDVLLSNELMAALGKRPVHRLVEALPEKVPEVIITARNLAHVVPSQWQTSIKNGRTWPWADFASRVCAEASSDPTSDGIDPAAWFWRRQDLDAIVTRWAEAVAVDRITVVTVPAEPTAEDGIATRFGSVLGVALGALAEPEIGRNPSLGAHSAELIRRLNVTLVDVDEADRDHRFRRTLGAQLAAHADQEPRFALSEPQYEWLRERVVRMVEAVAARGVRVVGDLTDLVPVPLGDVAPGASVADPAATSDADLLGAALRGFAGVVAEQPPDK